MCHFNGMSGNEKSNPFGLLFSGMYGLRLLHYNALCDCAARGGVLQQVYALGEGVQVEGCLGFRGGVLHELSACGIEEGEDAAWFG